MADMGDLEKMGRELKCPICLSLFRTAASITCNHIFCSGCITESMKSASSCPVCKVPFRRREIRPAPHMDNLVSIFKNMEAATGTSIVSTQVAHAATCADESKCDNAENTSGSLHKSMAQNAKKVPSKKKKNSTKGSAASASCYIAKPSFPTKKRILVTPFPESETPARPGKILKMEDPKNQQNGDVEDDEKKALTSYRPGSPSLEPFFWLREDDDGGSAETLSGPLTLDTPLRHNAPTYSDLQDSDDEIFHNKTPSSKAGAAGVFDSEIFEWTQRSCSPELCSTPLNKQTKDKQTLDQILEKDGGEDDTGIVGSFDKVYHTSNVSQPVNADEKKHTNKKRTSRTNKNGKSSNRVKLFTVESDANEQTSNDHQNLSAKSCQKKGSTLERNPSSRRNKGSTGRSQAVHSNDNSRKILSERDCFQTEVPDHQIRKGPKRKVMDRKGQKNGELEIAGENEVETRKNSSEPKGKRTKRMSEDGTIKKSGVLSGSGNKLETLQQKRIRIGFIKNLDDTSKKNKLCGEPNNKIGHESMESSPGGNTQSISAGRCQNKEAICTSVKTVSVKNNRAKGFEQSDSSGIKKFRKLEACTAGDAFLKKCEKTISRVCCAFCQSDDITEHSGEMVHYHDGKQVPAAFNEGANVIHSHKNCLEWAPDVYFEDDSVFNLKTELARSKRIKCACCGIKGAALGCFETSCRKSFHFTCAKLIPECRWDNDNFVMLCPIHRSSKLPNENSGCQKQSKMRTTPKGPFQVKSSYDCSKSWTWPSGSPQKWVFCCSALCVAEKGIVSEFAKLAGVTVLTSWSPSVTHIIASTDISGACKRTLKFLMAILNGKWIVSMDWVKTCMDCMKPVDEAKFEVSVDIHGISDGPRLGRHRVINKQPRLFDGMRFYLHGDYTKSYRGYLQDLVVAAGGTVLQRKPVSRDQQKLLDDNSLTFIVYCLENQEKEKSKDDINSVDRRRAGAQALACASGGKVASSAWIINSIAACNLQPL